MKTVNLLIGSYNLYATFQKGVLLAETNLKKVCLIGKVLKILAIRLHTGHINEQFSNVIVKIHTVYMRVQIKKWEYNPRTNRDVVLLFCVAELMIQSHQVIVQPALCVRCRIFVDFEPAFAFFLVIVFTTFIFRMARGVDIWVAQIV